MRRSARRSLDRTLKDLLPDASLVRHVGETVRTGESRSESETTIETPEGRAVPVSVATAPLFSRDGTVEAAVAVVRDISERRQAEEERIERICERVASEHDAAANRRLAVLRSSWWPILLRCQVACKRQ